MALTFYREAGGEETPNGKGTQHAVSNTIVGLVALAAGGLGFIASSAAQMPLLIGTAVLMVGGAVVAWLQPSADGRLS